MGLFDFFKKKQDQQKRENPSNENILEESLRKASAEPAFRPEFYRLLLTENLIVITEKTDGSGSGMLEKGKTVNIVALQDGRLPVFTSASKVLDKGVIKEKVPILELKGEHLFDLAKSATFILNPFSDYSKELLPDEIVSLLDGTILEKSHRKITVEKDTKVQIGQPANYPDKIVTSLKKLFQERAAVKAAYLGWIFNPESADPPHLIFALDIEGEMQAITNEAGFIAQEESEPGEIFDFIQIDDSGLSDYFLNKTTAFYMRGKS